MRETLKPMAYAFMVSTAILGVMSLVDSSIGLMVL